MLGNVVVAGVSSFVLRARLLYSVALCQFAMLSGTAFFSTAVNGLKTVVTAIGAGLAVWGVINLLEGYGNDNPGAKSQGIKQLMAGGGVVIIAQTVIPQMSSLFSGG